MFAGVARLASAPGQASWPSYSRPSWSQRRPALGRKKRLRRPPRRPHLPPQGRTRGGDRRAGATAPAQAAPQRKPRQRKPRPAQATPGASRAAAGRSASAIARRLTVDVPSRLGARHERSREARLRARVASRREPAVERDYKYARNWTDAWYVTGTSLIALNLVGIFQFGDYRVSEAVVFGALSTLLMIQVPTATTNGKALEGIRAAAVYDPCLALANASYTFEVNRADQAEHQTAFAYIFPVALNVVATAIVGLAEGHFDFVGHGSEGLSALVGIAAGELQVMTYPGASMKVNGSSLHMTF